MEAENLNFGKTFGNRRSKFCQIKRFKQEVFDFFTPMALFKSKKILPETSQTYNFGSLNLNLTSFLSRQKFAVLQFFVDCYNFEFIKTFLIYSEKEIK